MVAGEERSAGARRLAGASASREGEGGSSFDRRRMSESPTGGSSFDRLRMSESHRRAAHPSTRLRMSESHRRAAHPSTGSGWASLTDRRLILRQAQDERVAPTGGSSFDKLTMSE